MVYRALKRVVFKVSPQIVFRSKLPKPKRTSARKTACSAGPRPGFARPVPRNALRTSYSDIVVFFCTVEVPG